MSSFVFIIFVSVVVVFSHVNMVIPTSAPRTVAATNHSYAYFEDPANEEFSHMTVNDYTGQVYIGAVNRIYQLSGKLALQASVELGPRDDSAECPVTKVCPRVAKKRTDYWNKAMVIDYPQSRLISCGSLFQGICLVHKLDNVSVYESPAFEPVVANNATASTVAFIAQGPPKLPRMHVLYVGVSYTRNGPYRADVPAVSSRSLDPNNMFSIAATGVTSGTRLLLNSLARDRYPIKYVYGFASKGFSYFVTVQKPHVSESPRPFISKLVRICQKDVNYYSYTEVPLMCRVQNGVDYNLAQAAFVGKPGSELAVSLGITAQDEVLFVAFAKSKEEEDVYNNPSAESALCVYALSAIHRKFTQNIQHCFNGNGNQGLDFVNPSQPCVPTQVQINDDFCGMDVNTPLGGSMPVEAAPVLAYNDVLLSSVAAVSTHDYTVAFLGTDRGELKKAVVESVTSAFEYSHQVIDESRRRISADVAFNPNNEHQLYLMSSKRVTLVEVQNCRVYSTCSECLGARDPYCGWCSLENKCSLRGGCAEAAADPLYWLSYKSGKCTTITSVTPPKIQRTTARTLALMVDNLPALEGQFFCAFSALGKTQITNASRSVNGITCPTPSTDSLAKIPPGEHHFTAKLAVRMKTGPDFVATNFTFYDCSSYSGCTRCVSSPFPCDWCVGSHRCTHDTGEHCRNDVLVTGVSQVGPSVRSGPSFCPKIETPSNASAELLVPSGSSRKIQVTVRNIPQFIVSQRFVCQFNIEGRVSQVNAQLLGETIYCEAMNFSYDTDAANISAAFAVIWDGIKPLDNPDAIHVLVYQCRGMASNCGFCLELPSKYGCGWCEDRCEVRDKCLSASRSKYSAAIVWLDPLAICPDPQILDFSPKSGPWEGGTNITIHGINLGRKFENIMNGVHVAHEQNGVTVGLIKCIPFPELYVKTASITCQVQNPNITTGQNAALSGPLIVKIEDDYTAKSRDSYSFVNPLITSIEPSKGPAAGGTRLRIWGLYMNAGSHVVASVGQQNCEVVHRDTNKVECITSAFHAQGEEKVEVQFDNGVRRFGHYNFLYVENPRITSVESSSGTNGQSGIAKGIPHGGILIRVQGFHLNSVRSPLMFVEVDGIKYNSSCEVMSAVEMECRSPQVPEDRLIFGPNDYLQLHYGFIMDGVESVQRLTKRRSNPFAKFLMFRNPVYESFADAGGIKYYKSDYLTINGHHLDEASHEIDVKVQIGRGFCNVTSLSRKQLTCRPPTSQPQPLNAASGAIPEVIVVIGDSLNYTIGKLSYESPRVLQPHLPKTVLFAVIAGSCILIVIVIIILILYRRKSSESSRVLKTMQEQMDVLELRVASECKEAFAELQTEMTDLTGQTMDGGIPFLDYRIFAMKVLFPTDDDHAVLREMEMDPKKKLCVEKGLRLFGQLIMNKTFILLFIRTLEANRYFSMKDRVNVASLLMVTLQGKMEYCTDILKTLLADLIEKCMEGKKHPKLLLRRTESVAEKMLSAWFTFLLYKFLRECAGEPLYLLYRAIKQQVDKGPVDQLTSEARYSLSEDKLIRQSIEYKPLTVFVSMSPQTAYVSGLDPLLAADNVETPVKVLDCDSIDQVKEKALDAIYRNIPCSARPSKDDLDLEWRTGHSGRLILSLEDATSRREGEWRRINTLAHYKVGEGASLTLVPKQNSMYNISILNEKMVDKSQHKYETLNFGHKGSLGSPPLSRATSPLAHDNDGGYKQWHLVRHTEHGEQKEGDRGNKMVSEIYLTRLLATKLTLQKFVDDLFETIFSTAMRGSSLPLAIKYMFDFLDDQAINLGITDFETVHTWKSNSLPLRFWVNLIKNPNFIFDINKSNIVDSCLSVVAQTFMDACSTSDHRLGKDSPSSKLLYAKDIPVYKDWVEGYYRDIQMMPAISDQDMNAMFAEESRQHAHEFNTNVALHELYAYAVKHNDQLMQNLDEDEFSRKSKLSYKLEQVHLTMAGELEQLC